MKTIEMNISGGDRLSVKHQKWTAVRTAKGQCGRYNLQFTSLYGSHEIHLT